MSKPTPTITPPIPDSNNNGILDGKDVLAQMKKEEVNGSARAASERAHGVFETLATRQYVIDINQIAANGQMLNPKAFEIIAAEMNQNIEHQVATTKAKMDKDPNYSKKAEENIRLLSKSLGLTQANTDMNVADERNFNEFVKTFGATFPKGVKIEAQDVPQILAHFGQLAVNVPKAPAPSKKESITI